MRKTIHIAFEQRKQYFKNILKLSYEKSFEGKNAMNNEEKYLE